MTLDAGRAVLHLIEDETVLVEPPGEKQEAERAAGRDPAIAWRVKKILYGRRKAPRSWLLFLGGLLKEVGFVQSKTAPRVLQRPDGHVLLEVHMDDIHSRGPKISDGSRRGLPRSMLASMNTAARRGTSA